VIRRTPRRSGWEPAGLVGVFGYWVLGRGFHSFRIHPSDMFVVRFPQIAEEEKQRSEPLGPCPVVDFPPERMMGADVWTERELH
jgi:hypothetical protein